MNWAEISAGFEEAARSTSLTSWLATFTAVIYVILAARENIFCWPFGILSSGLSVGVYASEELFFESLLNILYVVLGVYGWYQWRKQKTNAGGPRSKPITNLDVRTGVLLAATGIAGSVALGWFSWHFKTSSLPWADAAITVFSVVATWMTAKKIIENWIAWVFIDAAATVVYIVKGPSMYLFALLFIFFTLISVAGYFSWRKIQQTSGA
jgi:nicotinamide mononucleotide transporter